MQGSHCWAHFSLIISTTVVHAQSSNFDSNTAFTVTSDILPSQTSQVGCPTVTATGELCTTCPVPACLGLATITQSCGCPTAIPTVFVDFPCASGCSGIWCSTSYAIVTASDCSEGVSSSPSPRPTGEVTSTLLPNATTSSSTSSQSTVSANAAARMKAPFRLW